MLQILDTLLAFAVVMLLFSLVITAFVQAISALLDLRGRNLVWTLTALFVQIQPELSKIKVPRWASMAKETAAHQIARAVVTCPALAGSNRWWPYAAKAIRPHELINALDSIRRNPPEFLAEGAKDKLAEMLDRRISAARLSAESIHSQVGKMKEGVPELSEMLDEAVKEAAGATRHVVVAVADWFNAVMDRSSDRFLRNTRTVTIVAAVVLVSVLQVDAIRIFGQVSTNADLRNRLIQMSSAVQDQARDALDRAARASTALREMANDPAMSAFATDLNKAPATLMSCADGEQWLQAQPPLNTVDVLQAFDRKCAGITQRQIETLTPRLQSINAQLRDTQLQLVPAWPEGRFASSNLAWWKSSWVGAITAIVLLSLGAPFWFNLLRQLSSLRPSVSRKIADEKVTTAT